MVQATHEQRSYLELNAEANLYNEEGKLQLYKDKESARQYFKNYINPSTMFFHDLKEKLDFLIEEKYYEEDLFDKFTFDEVKSLFKHAYSYKFRFESLAGAVKFYNQYALKTYDGERFLERYEDRVAVNAIKLSDGDYKAAIKIIDEIISGRYQPATPTFLNLGKCQRGEYSSCFLVSLSDDLNSIFRGINSAAQLSKRGGGVGINLSNIRGESDPIKGYEGMSSGVIPVMKILEDTFSYANQLGARQGSGVVYLHANHIDILDFMDTKKENADEKRRIKSLSLGIVMPDIVFELAKNGEDMYMFSPYDVTRELGVPFAKVDMTKHYRDLVNNPRVRKEKVGARKFLSKIAELQMESGYPYLLFIDTANRENVIDGHVEMSNLCVEILQVQTAPTYRDDQSIENIGQDIICNLGSLNVAKAIKSEDFEDTIDTAMRTLSWVSDNVDVTSVPSIKHGNEMMHAVGLGAMNLHGAFVEHGLEYGSPESIEFTKLFFAAVNYYSIKSSMNQAKERGVIFEGFEKSGYADGSYFDKFIDYASDYYKSDNIRKIFEGIMPSKEDWEQLRDDVAVNGLYNAYRLAVPPTGSISYVNNSVPSILPCTAPVEIRKEGKSGRIYYPMPGLTDENMHLWKDAYDVGWEKLIDVCAAAQFSIDQGISMTVFFDDTVTTRELNRAQIYAWQKGIKTMYYTRLKADIIEGTDKAQECVSCSV